MALDSLEPATYRLGADEAEAAFALAERRFVLVVLSGGAKGRTVALPPGNAELKIGKAADNDLPLPDAAVSRYHCVIRHDASGWVLKDLDSTNGTFLDDARVKESYLHAGATLRVGDVAIRCTGDLRPLQIAPSDADRFGTLVGSSVRMREIFALLERLAQNDATILMTGETGTGKGAIARALHGQSRRKNGPFVVVDCSAVAPNLIESELFGHERGAFTGAEQRRLGALEQADGGTLFLDELDDLRKDLQAKLLRALEDRTFQRLGAAKPQRFDARVVAATKKNLGALVEKGQFREDLYFRLAVFHVDLPPLRRHKEDVPALVDQFGELFGRKGTWQALSPEVREKLLGHPWPGNVRELRNAVERAFALAVDTKGAPPGEAWTLGATMFASHDPLDLDYTQPFKDAKDSLNERFEREYVTRLLARCGGNVSRAAREAKVDRSYIYTLLKKHGLDQGREPGGSDEG